MNIHNGVGIMITESWISDNILNAELNIQNFYIFRGDRCDRFRGGSAERRVVSQTVLLTY